MKTHLSRLKAAGLSLLTAAALAQGLPGGKLTASAASTEWKFDFGGGGVQSGYTGVSASDGYNASRGYGFSSGTSVANVSASGIGALSDAVQFKNSTPTGGYTFCADVPNGLYQVSVWLGNTNRTSIAIENMYQIMNMTGNGAYHTLQVPITDGQLNICACAGKEGYAYSIAALEIKQISTQTHTNPTVWVCGDSTVCNYYPLNASTQAGWAQMLPDYLDSREWQVMNMATGGQFAKGFVDAGQFKVIEKNGQPGDIYVISIGINDTNYSNADEYKATVTDMAKRAMAKGMRVILVKQQGRDGDILRNPKLGGRWFGGQLDAIGAELGIEVVDLFNLWQDFRISINDPNPSPYYMSGDDLHINRKGAAKLAEFMAAAINAGAAPLEGEIFADGAAFMFRNVESGYVLAVEDGKAEAGANVSQSAESFPSDANTWKLKAAENEGEYYIYSMLGGGETYLLDVEDGKTANGTNIGIWTDTQSNAQRFKIFKEGDVYHIATAVTDFKSYVGIWGGSHDDKANAIEWENDRTDNQKWQMLPAAAAGDGPLLQGDLDGDGKVTAKDLTLAKRAILTGSDKYNTVQAIDVNGDMKADSTDIAALRDYLLGKTKEFADTKYAAAEQIIDQGWREETNTGFLYRDYMNLDNNNSSSVTFAVNVPFTGNYLCSFNIANASANDRAMMISVSGSTDTWKQSFLPTGAWTTWEERALVLPLNAGINYIKLKSDTAEGGPNIDYLKLTFTDEPVAEPYDPNAGGQTAGPVSDKPTVYIASDSTAQTYRASYAPQQGWGYYLGNYFTDAVTVANHSIAGRSSKSFYDDGRLTTILDSIQSGDFLLVDFGINDGAATQPQRYAPVCGNADNPTDGSFEYYMTFYIKGALDKGATPILMSPTLSIKNATQPFSAGYRNIDSACKMLANKYKIPYFDLGAAMVTEFNKIDYNTVYKYYLGGATGGTDFTHFAEEGADAVAKIVANGIKGLNTDLSKYVK